MEKKKKIWTEPKLTALVRRKPEEGILLICKYSTQRDGPGQTYSNCWILSCTECWVIQQT
jgi:hypothetical protein